jgi:ElaB/YqjD/DUF883 family membrane-anchored ribosome-binding protein
MLHSGAKEVTMANPTTAKPKKPAAKAAAAAPEAKQRFAKAIEEARAGAQALTKEAQERAEAYREKAVGQSSEWIDEAKELSGQAKDKAFILANEGKARASEAISGLGQIVEDNAATIDEKVGPKYGDYARTAAKGMKDAAEKIDQKDLGELGEDAKEFVRKSPGVAVAIAAAAGFVLARLFKKSNS